MDIYIYIFICIFFLCLHILYSFKSRETKRKLDPARPQSRVFSTEERCLGEKLSHGTGKKWLCFAVLCFALLWLCFALFCIALRFGPWRRRPALIQQDHKTTRQNHDSLKSWCIKTVNSTPSAKRLLPFRNPFRKRFRTMPPEGEVTESIFVNSNPSPPKQ